MNIYKVTSKKQEPLGEQAFEVMSALESFKDGATMAQVAKKIAPKITTVQTPERIAGWYLKIFVEQGYASAHKVKTTKPAPKAAKTKAAKPAKHAPVLEQIAA